MDREAIGYSNLKKVEHLFRTYYKVLRIYTLRFVEDLNVTENIRQAVLVAGRISFEYTSLPGSKKMVPDDCISYSLKNGIEMHFFQSPEGE